MGTRILNLGMVPATIERLPAQTVRVSLGCP